jgi:hypothetical protein
MNRKLKKFNWRDVAFIGFWLLLALFLLLTFTGCKCFSCEPTIHYGPSGKPFPTNWGKPPEWETKDVRPLPYGYGHGSSTLNGWIIENTKKDLQHRLNNLPSTGGF